MLKNFFLLQCCFAFCAGQSMMSQNVLDNTLSVYQNKIGEQAGLYNGSQYLRNNFISIGHPFFLADSLLNGSVYYDGVFYKDILLMYDEVLDEVISVSFDRRNLIQLVKSKVDSFIINDHFFARKKEGQTEVYYQQLYSGKSILYKREEKSISTKIGNPNENELGIRTRYRYLARVDSQQIEIKNRKAFLKALGKHRTAIERHLAGEKINYRRSPDLYFVSGIKHYDELSN